MPSISQKIYAWSLSRYFDWLRVVHRKPLHLYFRNGGIGDILCTFPAAAVLSRRSPEAFKIYCTHPDFVALPGATGCFDRVLGIKCSDLVAHYARRHNVFSFRYPDENPGSASKAYLADEFSAQFNLPPGQPWPSLKLGPQTPQVTAFLAQLPPGPFACIHTGPSWKVREWPRASWEKFVAELKVRHQLTVVQIGSHHHFQEGTRPEAAIEGAIDGRGRFDLLESLQLISRARLVVGIDSGMIHAAVAVNTPVVGIFGPTSGFLRLPASPRALAASADIPCIACHHRHPRLHWRDNCPHDIRCMRELSPDQLLSSVERVLKGSTV